MARGPSGQQMSSDQGGVGAAQHASSKFIVFSGLTKINTKSARDALPENEAAWLENLQPIAVNNLVMVPGGLLPALAGAALPPSRALFGANIGAIDYLIDFTAAGGGWAVNTQNGSLQQFAPDNTFGNPDMTVYASERILIMDTISGYSTWDGTVFVRGGGLSPNIQVTTGGSGYTAVPAITFSGGSGTGASAHAVIADGAVLSIVLNTAGSGYLPGEVVTVGIGGPGTGAAATVLVWPVVTGTTIAVFEGRV